jgi:hypothetical protein
LLSKKYNPVTAKFDFVFFGFSLIEDILFLFLILLHHIALAYLLDGVKFYNQNLV